MLMLLPMKRQIGLGLHLHVRMVKLENGNVAYIFPSGKLDSLDRLGATEHRRCYWELWRRKTPIQHDGYTL